MADTKISALSPAGSLTGTEQFPVVQAAATVRTTLNALLALAAAMISDAIEAAVVTAVMPAATGVEATDTAAFDAVLASLPANGGVIQFRPGSYLGSMWVTKPNVRLTGSWASEIKTPPNSVPGDNDACVRLLADGCTVENLTLNGNKANQTLTDNGTDSLVADGVGIYANDCTVRNCHIKNVIGHGVIVWNTAFGAVPIGARKDNTVDGNLFSDGSIHRSCVDVAYGDADWSVRTKFINNRFRDSPSGITIHGAFGVMIRGNTLYNCGFPMRVHNNCKQIVITDNVVEAGPDYSGGILCDGTATIYEDVIVANNIVRGSNSSGIRISGNTGGMENVLVHDNRVEAPLSYGIAVDGITTNVRIHDNIITDPTGNSCIHIDADSANAEVHDNFCRRSGGNGITVRANGTKVWQNTIKDAAIGVNLPSPEFATGVRIDDNVYDNVASKISATGSYPIVQRRAIRKTADETVTASTTLQDDNELLAPLGGPTGTEYAFTVAAMLISPSAADIKIGFTVPAGATLQWAVAGPVVPLNTTGTETVSTSGSNQMVTIEGSVVLGATPGNLVMQWAQATSDGGNTRVLAGSTLRVTEAW